MSFSNEVAKRREAALARAQEAVPSRRCRALRLDVAAWLEAGQWGTLADDLVRDLANLPIAVFAADELTRRRRKLRKKGKSLGELDPESRHKLRIQTKKLRYAADFFDALSTGKCASRRKRRFFYALERLQDGLGNLNDIAVHEQRIERLGLHSTQVSQKEAFAAGLWPRGRTGGGGYDRGEESLRSLCQVHGRYSTGTVSCARRPRDMTTKSKRCAVIDERSP